jgi:MFS family permease
LINLPLGLAALLALVYKVPESYGARPAGAVDYPGAALAALGLAGLTYGFISAPSLGFGDARVFAALLGGVGALAGFVALEARSANPIMPLAVFRSRTFSGTNLLTLFLYGALSVGTFFLSLNLVIVQGYSQSQAGLAFTPFGMLLATFSRWTGGLADRYGPRRPLIAGPVLAGLGFLIWAFAGLTAGPSSYWSTFFPGVVVFGLGMAITVAPLTAAVMGAVASHSAGTASGINNAVSRIAGVLALAMLGALALALFADAVAQHTAGLPLSDVARAAVRRAAGQFGAAPPVEVAPEQASAVRLAFRQAFADMFQIVLLICAALAWLSAVIAALFVHDKAEVFE